MAHLLSYLFQLFPLSDSLLLAAEGDRIFRSGSSSGAMPFGQDHQSPGRGRTFEGIIFSLTTVWKYFESDVLNVFKTLSISRKDYNRILHQLLKFETKSLKFYFIVK